MKFLGFTIDKIVQKLSGTLHLGAARIVITALSFISMILVSNNMPKEEFGLYALILGYYAYAVIFAEFGLRTVATNELSKDVKSEAASRIYSSYIILRVFIAFLCISLIAVITSLVRPDIFVPVMLVMASLIFAALHTDWLFISAKNYLMAGYAATIRWFLYLALVLISILILQDKMEVKFISAIFLCSWILTILITWHLVSRKVNSKFRISAFNKVDSKNLVVRGIPVLGSTLIYQLLQNFDLLWVGYHFGSASAGSYYIANSVVSAGFIFSNSMSQIALAKHAGIESKPASEIKRFLFSDLKMILALALVMSAAIYFLFPLLVPIFFGDNYTDAGALCIYLIPYFVFYQISAVLAFFMIAIKMQKQVFLSNLLVAALLPLLLIFAVSFETVEAIALVKGLIMLVTIFAMSLMLFKGLQKT